MEQRWLDAGAAGTHIIWGRLRVFSNYSEAAQFGCSQAHIALICGILALGPFSWTKKLLLAVAALLLLYGMLISGTRSAFFVIIVGAFVYLALSKQLKVLLLGIMLAIGAFMVLKYTNIGDSNPDIYRMRSALNPEDASLQVRFTNQAKLREYLSTRPFGGGVGVMGEWGKKYNPGQFLSTIPPDSYYVKIWGSYGIVGFVVWFGIMLFILGKCAGIVWRIRDPLLRQKLLALTAGAAGILMASYGNEIMNQMPSCMILYVSWVLVFVGPELDTPALKPVSRV
nr:O-antigen ligase family protein [Hymenobacter negativus]